MGTESFEGVPGRFFEESPTPRESVWPATQRGRPRRPLAAALALAAALLAGSMWWPNWDGRGTRGASCEQHREFLESPEVPDDYRRGSLKSLFRDIRLNEEAIREAAKEPGIIGEEARYYLKVLDDLRKKNR